MRGWLVACVWLAGCANQIAVTGTVGGRSFDAVDGYFSQVAHGYPQGGIEQFTSITLTSYDGACPSSSSGDVGNYVELDATMTTGDGPTGDLAAHGPGVFPVAYEGIVGNRALAEGSVWTQSSPTFSSGAGMSFESGYLRVLSVSSSELDGELEWKTSAGDHVKGTFQLSYCQTFSF